MYKEVGLLGLYCESSVHAGSGSDLGVIDLPIQREKPTGYPIFYGSTLKGAIRSSFDSRRAVTKSLINGVFDEFSFVKDKDALEEAINIVFGDEENQLASAISFTDAKILLFPIKSAKNVFSWITCPNILSRLKRDLEIANIESGWEIPEIKKEAVISPKLDIDKFNEESVILEEYSFETEKNDEVIKIAEWINQNIIASDDNYWHEKLKEDLIILDNDEFKDFATMSTEVVARTKIDNKTKIVEDGALWYEENLPPESVLYSLAMVTNILREETNEIEKKLKSAKDIINFLEQGLQDRIQLGGNETIGRGIIRTNFNQGGSH